MSRIKQRFQALAASDRKALIPYIVAGDPSLEHTAQTMHELVAAGADIIELGVPFSDPMAEGPVIQAAHERALDKGVRLRDVLACVAQFRERDQDTPVLLMGYANPVVRMGYKAFAEAAQSAGVDALLTVDLPPEEVAELNAQLRAVDMDNILLVAPTTPDERVPLIAADASGFIYCVSLKGVTGAGHLDTEMVAKSVARIRAHSTLPVAVGFGIKDAASARQVAAAADGVVVGSALVQKMAATSDPQAAAAAAAELVAEIRHGIDTIAS